MNRILFGDTTALLNELFEQLSSAVPKVLMALVVLILGYIIVKIVSGILFKVLKKLQVDKLGDRLNEIEVVDKSPIVFKLSKLFSKMVYYFLMLFVLVIATDLLDMPAVSDLVASIFKFVPHLIAALLILILGLLLSNVIKNIVETTCTSLGIPSAKLIGSFVFYFLFVNVIILALTQAGIETEFLAQNLSLVIGGAVLAFAIGYGFASKDVVANYLGSFYSKDKVQEGDHISIAGTTGKVVSIDKSSITISTDKGMTIIPMSKLTSENIEILND